MPLYEYHCSKCNIDFEEIKAFKDMNEVSCPECEGKATVRVSTFTWKNYHLFTKDGEGFSSVTYRPEEYRERVKYNLGKNDKL